MIVSPLYVLECHEHGWLFCAAPMQSSIPTNALGDCMKLFPKNAVANPAIAKSINALGYRSTVIMAVGSPASLARWEKEIEAHLADRSPEDRWWLGTEKGSSSTAIFRVLCSDRWKATAMREGSDDVPWDSGDFGRCKRLLERMPEWRERLPEVAEAYPATRWPAIIARWDELLAASDEQCREILDAIHRG